MIRITRISFPLLALLLAVSTGCATHKHYHAYLLTSPEAAKDDTRPGARTYYVSTLANTIIIPRGKAFQIRIDEIHMAYLHRYIEAKRARHPRKVNREGLAGKELWLVAESNTLHPTDVLGLREDHTLHATNVKIDQESFTLMPVSHTESVILQHEGDTSCRVTMKVYEVDGYKLKQALARAAYDTQEDLVSLLVKVYRMTEGTGSDVLKWVVPSLKKRAEEPFFFEKLLLASGGTVEFSGTVDILVGPPMKEGEGAALKAEYALFDVAKYLDAEFDHQRDKKRLASRSTSGESAGHNEPVDIDLTPDNIGDYVDTYREFHKPVVLPSEETFRAAFRVDFAGEHENTLHDLYKPYIKFFVEPREKLSAEKTLGVLTEFMLTVLREAESLADETAMAEPEQPETQPGMLTVSELRDIVEAARRTDQRELLTVLRRVLERMKRERE